MSCLHFYYKKSDLLQNYYKFCSLEGLVCRNVQNAKWLKYWNLQRSIRDVSHRQVNEIPVNLNGKVDEKKLAEYFLTYKETKISIGSDA